MNEKQNKFLEHWKQGVNLVGTQFFDIKSKDVESANDKSQLAPNYPFIKETFGALSHGEKVMLALMYSFYDPECGQELLVDAYAANFVDAIMLLDDKRKAVIMGLLDSHSGW